VVQGDTDALARALENLIENAFVHGPSGGTVTVSLRRQDDRALLSVSDEGAGPPPDQRDQVFERFWRGPGTGGTPGSGLGLSIVAAIATRHHGRVAIQDSTFTIELPAAP
jgi:signal transduction histidine kinase